MSALGQKRTCAMHQPMSALPPIANTKADIRRRASMVVCLEPPGGEVKKVGPSKCGASALSFFAKCPEFFPRKFLW